MTCIQKSWEVYFLIKPLFIWHQVNKVKLHFLGTIPRGWTQRVFTLLPSQPLPVAAFPHFPPTCLGSRPLLTESSLSAFFARRCPVLPARRARRRRAAAGARCGRGMQRPGHAAARAAAAEAPAGAAPQRPSEVRWRQGRGAGRKRAGWAAGGEEPVAERGAGLSCRSVCRRGPAQPRRGGRGRGARRAGRRWGAGRAAPQGTGRARCLGEPCGTRPRAGEGPCRSPAAQSAGPGPLLTPSGVGPGPDPHPQRRGGLPGAGTAVPRLRRGCSGPRQGWGRGWRGCPQSGGSCFLLLTWRGKDGLTAPRLSDRYFVYFLFCEQLTWRVTSVN